MIFDEIIRHCEKLDLNQKFVEEQVLNILGKNITKSPTKKTVEFLLFKSQ